MTDEPTTPTAELTLEELHAQATELEIDGRSKMDREQLVAAIAEAQAAASPGASTAEPGPPAPDVDEPTLEELRDHARELKIDGRSKMDREQLVAAIAAEQARLAGHHPAGDQPAAPVDVDEVQPTPDHIVGRPPLTELAQERAANRNPRVIGAP